VRRSLVQLLVCLALVTAAAEAARAALPARIDVRAHGVNLYAGATPVLGADGAAVVHAGKRVIRADALRYDLQKNTLVASGHVVVTTASGELHATAYALDVASGEATALRVDGALPQAVALHGDDVAGVIEPPPAGAFDVADLAGEKPYVRGPHAVIVPNASVRIAPAHVMTDFGTALPSPSYLYSFAANPSFAQQSIPASTFDQPYGLFGTGSSLASLHFLYSPGSGPALGLDVHLVNRSKSYLVASLLPTVGGGRVDLLAFDQLTPTLTQQLTVSRQAGIAGGQYQLLHNEANSVTSLTLNQAGGFQSADLRISTLSRMMKDLFSYKLSAGVGYDHQNGMLPLSSSGRATIDGLVTTPSLHGPLGTSASASLDVGRTVYNYPRETGSGVLTGFISKQVAPAVRLLGQVQFVQVFDRYRTDQSFFYPPQTLTLPNGSIYYGYAAYNGSSTLRTYALTGTYSPSANFNLQLSLTHHRDFPQWNGYGNPPFSLGFDLRLRPPGGPTIELGRSYIFDWGGQRFSPAYTLSVAP
jgi:hypothetical protein